ncbi:hypothetical protein BMW23_0668 [Bodo saltans virus]|uniref:Uncharacterized protein n=1 Tax=Bodo saltans virus TaxID=2024608 RepID=A0A2H4UV27_9VIRU|nr:hypothetical protein QJ851_gp0651 [Bodo saltans virus]ATZ80714.1 hypothetical protein BMW23_0668 [Bodo saltans virus]
MTHYYDARNETDCQTDLQIFTNEDLKYLTIFDDELIVMYDIRHLIFEFNYKLDCIDFNENTEFCYIVKYIKKMCKHSDDTLLVAMNLFWKLSTQIIRDNYDANICTELFKHLYLHNIISRDIIIHIINTFEYYKSDFYNFCESKYGCVFFQQLKEICKK